MILTATTALPYPHLQRATAGLRAELRHRMLDAGLSEAPEWSALEVSGPVEIKDARGHVWSEYRAVMAG